jgi:hypothetical protein
MSGQEWVSILAAIGALITSTAAAVNSLRNSSKIQNLKTEVTNVQGQVGSVHSMVDGRMTAFWKDHKAAQRKILALSGDLTRAVELLGEQKRNVKRLSASKEKRPPK